MASYLTVSSNDTLTHRALEGSPETLCGKIVVDVTRPREVPELNDITGGPLQCDICEALTGGDEIIKETTVHQAGRECPYCEDGTDASGLDCLDCRGTGWLSEGDDDYDSYTDLDFDTGDLRGVRVASGIERCYECGEEVVEGDSEGVYHHAGPDGVDYDLDADHAPVPDFPQRLARVASPQCVNCGESYSKDGGITCASCGSPTDRVNTQTPADEGRAERFRVEHGPEGAVEIPSGFSEYSPAKAYEALTQKSAANWTRDGDRIENGFDVVTIDKETAARTPFLDHAKVAISERHECPDCGKTEWLSKVSSCIGCDGLKCNSCMETLDVFLGTCKKCAGAESDDDYLAYDDPYIEGNIYMSYLMSEEDDGETDPLFLPSDPS